MNRLRRLITALAVAIVPMTIAAAPSDAAPSKREVRAGYDGLWSVLIVTRAGPCDPTYRYPVRIFRGRVLQVDNDFSYQLMGVVARNGDISVTVTKSGQSATGYGQLRGWRGGGLWNAAGGQCSGDWSALRRN